MAVPSQEEMYQICNRVYVSGLSLQAFIAQIGRTGVTDARSGDWEIWLDKVASRAAGVVLR
jgi:hypothetical protein